MESKIIEFLKNKGCSATWLMRLEGIGTANELRKQLRKMEKEGKVTIDPNFSSKNNLVWRLSSV